MIALIAGTGDLPGVLAARLVAAGDPPVICAMEGFPPQVPGHLPRLDFRIETLGTLLATLAQRGVTRLCLAGAVRRPVIDPAAVDAATAPLIPALAAAMGKGDDGTLRAIIALLEGRGFTVVGAADLAPDLVLPEGVPTRIAPGDDDRASASLAQGHIALMGMRDAGQACIIRDGKVIVEEGPEGTDAMMARLLPPRPSDDYISPSDWFLRGLRDYLQDSPPPVPAGQGGFLFKAPKPGQELRADMPVIGPRTAMLAAEAGLDGIVIEAGGVMVIDPDQVLALLDGMGLWLWVRERTWR